jgi:hypothetical protein
VTSEDIARRSGVVERYVREWCSARAASGYLEYEADGETFTLPPEQAMAFADENSPAYMLGGYHVISSAYKDRSGITERIRAGEGFGWHEHDPELFSGTEQFFRPGYRAHLWPTGSRRSIPSSISCGPARRWPTWAADTGSRPS